MDIRLLFIIAPVAFLAGYILGTRFGVRVAVKSYLKEEGAYDKALPVAWTEYYDDVRAQLGGQDMRGARAWTRRHNLPFNAETLALYNDAEYRKGVDGDSDTENK